MMDNLNQAYRLGSILGQGGGGTVYRATQQSTGQDVAVKVLSLAAPGPEGSAAGQEKKIERFKREMRICAQLKHPGIVSLIDYGANEEGRHFLVFEYVPGETLATFLAAEGALKVEQAVSVAKQLLLVLSYAHGRGIVHRDLKPSNLMLGNHSIHQIRVLDFGTATLLGPRATQAHLTVHGEVVGTPAYAAPEQLRGDAPRPRSDLYAWGLVVLECLTGSNPMAGPSVGAIFARQLSTEAVPLPPQLARHPLGRILHWALQKDPASRVSSAADLLHALCEIDVKDLADASGFLSERQTAGAVPAPIAVPETVVSAMGASESRPIVLVSVRLPRAPSLNDDEMLHLQDLVREHMSIADGTALAALGELQLYAFGLGETRDYAAVSAGRAALRLPMLRGVRSQTTCLVGIHVTHHVTSERSRAQLAGGRAASIAITLADPELDPVHGADSAPNAEHEMNVRIRVSEDYRVLAGRAFRFDGAVPLLARGLEAETLSTWLLAVEEPGAEELAHFVGREAQLEELRRAAMHETPAVWLRGPAGIGKSRLAREFHTRSGIPGIVKLRHSTELQHVALGAVMHHLQTELLPREPSLSDVVSLLQEYEVYGVEQVSVLATWLGLDLAPPYAPLPHSPRVQREILQNLLSELVAKLCVRQNAFFLVEDLHWADFSSREWLESLILRLTKESVFSLLTSRPGVDLKWNEVNPVAIDLTELEDKAAADLVSSVQGAEQLTPEQVAAIVSRGGGTPFFIEELTLAALQQGRSQTELPTVLQDVVGRQLDRVGTAKRTLRVASVIGNEFELPLLNEATANDRELLPELELLVSHQILLRVETGGTTRFSFRHALLRDTAYASIPESEARQVHKRMGEILASSRGLTNPGRAARHLARGGAPAAAIGQFVLAAERSLAIGAHQEAKTESDEGFRCLGELADSPSRNNLELDLIRQKLAAFFHQSGASLPEEGVGLLQRGSELLEKTTLDEDRAFGFRWSLWEAMHVRPDQRAAWPLAEQLLHRASAIGTAHCHIGAEDAAGRTAFFMGQLGRASNHFKQGIALHDPSMSASLGKDFVVDPAVNCFSFNSIIQLFQGHLSLAKTTYDQALNLARSAGPYGALAGVLATCTTLDAIGQLEEDSPDFSEAQTRLTESVQLSTEYGQPIWGIMAQAWMGILAAKQGAPGVLQMLAEQLTPMVGAHGSSLFVIPVARLLADQDPVAALRLLDAFDAATEVRAEFFLKAEAVRIRARASRGLGKLEDGQAQAKEALRLAQSEHLHLFEVRAAAELVEANQDGAGREWAIEQLAQSLRIAKEIHLDQELPSVAKLVARFL